MVWDRSNGEKTTPPPQTPPSPAPAALPTFNFDFDFQAHDWVQGGEHGGDEIGCSGIRCSVGHRHGHKIPGLQLVGSRGNWSLIKEGGTLRLKP